jgi:uncharacterized protein (DUF1501 family)
MKRRNFIKNLSLASLSLPFISNGFGMQAITKKLFGSSKNAEDRVLIIIRLNGGNDGLNMIIPIDQYDNLMIQRPNIILPQNQILSLTNSVGIHPIMTGMKTMFEQGKLTVVQNVGYPEQNRSHFRSSDIWASGSLDINQTSGWMGRYFESEQANFPEDYPNIDFPDPFAISMGSELSTTCQGLMGNFSHAVSDPFNAANLLETSVENDGTYYGSQIEYIATMLNQTNEYGNQISVASNSGNSLSTLYDPTNSIAVQLKYIAQMISGGLKTKVYILNINGFDTHDSQVLQTNTTQGEHADLLKKLSDAIAAFQNDLQLLGLEERVAGMTFSEFGRQVASNGSFGTDHGDAAPLFLFGKCVNSGIIGPNPQINNQIDGQSGVEMEIDFRDVYASILKDWFEVPVSSIQNLFEHNITFINVLSGCTLGLSEDESLDLKNIVFPNPTPSNCTLKITTLNERVSVYIYSITGQMIKEIGSKDLSEGTHLIPCETSDLPAGNYLIQVIKNSGAFSLKLQKIK